MYVELYAFSIACCVLLHVVELLVRWRNTRYELLPSNLENGKELNVANGQQQQQQQQQQQAVKIESDHEGDSDYEAASAVHTPKSATAIRAKKVPSYKRLCATSPRTVSTRTPSEQQGHDHLDELREGNEVSMAPSSSNAASDATGDRASHFGKKQRMFMKRLWNWFQSLTAPLSLSQSTALTPSKFASEQAAVKLQRIYTLVYLLAIGADWVQGPYVYALYSMYGYNSREIGVLYVTGFASSAIFGTFMAALADRVGRKKIVLVFCLVYTVSCLVKHSSEFAMLFIGRLLGGIAYSIMCSVFESWFVQQHALLNLRPQVLSETFSKVQFWNGVTAILAGQVAGSAAQKWGKVAPFDIAATIFMITAALVALLWTENFGDASSSSSSLFRSAMVEIFRNERILLLGIVQTCFETTLYVFTFLWTPLLQEAADATALAAGRSIENNAAEIPHGIIFSTYMASMMSGSKIYAEMRSYFNISDSVLLIVSFIVSLLSFITASWFQSALMVHISFMAFELCCGIYFPSISTLRSPCIPESQRATILSIFRIPLNVLVVSSIYIDFTNQTICLICCVFMLLGLICQVRFHMVDNTDYFNSQESKGAGI